MTSLLGIIAGSGELPREVIRKVRGHGREVFVIAFDGITDGSTVADIPHARVNIGSVGKTLKLFKEKNIKDVVLAGRVGRPAPSTLSLDFTALKLLAKLRKLPSGGDNVVFSAIIAFLEQQGLKVLGAQDVAQDLLIRKGALGSVMPDKTAERDIALGIKAARKIGELDIGQAVVVQMGMVLGVEGAEGTDRLVSRCRELHQEGSGGVLVKIRKPGQDARVDMPTIGVHTVENAYASGLRGIAVEAESALVLNREKVVERANALGVFVVGIAQ